MLKLTPHDQKRITKIAKDIFDAHKHRPWSREAQHAAELLDMMASSHVPADFIRIDTWKAQ